MSVVYSTRIFAIKELSGPATFTVPPGYVYVIVNIDVYWGSQPTAPEGKVLGSAGQAFAVWQGAIDAPNIMSWRGRQVLYEGETMALQTQQGNADVTISAYALTIP